MAAKPRPINRTPLGTSISTFITVPDGIRYEPVRLALALVDSVHGDGELQSIPVYSRNLNAGTPAAYFSADNTAGGILFHSKMKIHLIDVLEELAHMLDHQVLGFQTWASLHTDSYLINVMQEIRKTPTIQKLINYRPGQLVRLKCGDHYEQAGPLIPEEVMYNQDPKEWFARAYVQFIAITTGNLPLLKEIGVGRSSLNREILYPRFWADEEFEPIAREIELVFVEKRWMQ